MPRYRTVLSSLLTEVHRLETTSIYTHVATEVLREVVSPLDNLPPW
jgi:site-specific recombinase XerD